MWAGIESGAKAAEAAGVTYWLSYAASSLPATYVLSAYSAGDLLTCAGGAFDARNLPDGPACLAAVAADYLGNQAVSEPIAICINATHGSACAGFDPNAVACSDGCTGTSFAPQPPRRQ